MRFKKTDIYCFSCLLSKTFYNDSFLVTKFYKLVYTWDILESYEYNINNSWIINGRNLASIIPHHLILTHKYIGIYIQIYVWKKIKHKIKNLNTDFDHVLINMI